MKKALFCLILLVIAASGCEKCYTCYPTGAPGNSQTICFTTSEAKNQLIATDSAGVYFFKDSSNTCTPN